MTDTALYHASLLWNVLIFSFPAKLLFFRVIPDCTLVQSRVVYWVLWISSMLFAILINPRNRKSTATIYAAFGFCNTLYLFASLSDLYPGQILLISACILLGVLAYGTLTLLRHSRTLRILCNTLYRCWQITGICLTAVLILFSLCRIAGVPLVRSSTTPKDPRAHSETLADKADTILLLQDALWEQLSAPERLDVLQTIANIEAEYLGLPHELTVISDPGEESLLGYYNDDTHCITICTDHLLRDHPRSVLLTLTHEAYHAYEHRLVDLFDSLSPQDRELLLFNRVQTYKQEFANYNDGSDDYFGYYFQRVEQDSDSYSTAAADRYYEVLENYIPQPD